MRGDPRTVSRLQVAGRCHFESHGESVASLSSLQAFAATLLTRAAPTVLGRLATPDRHVSLPTLSGPLRNLVGRRVARQAL
jgi:hypothetical protein